MATRHRLRDEQWQAIAKVLPGKKGDRGRAGADNRKFIEAVMWIGRTGAPWRDLPAEYGKWATVHKRFVRWAKAGVWQMIFNTFSTDPDNEWLMIDSTIVRAHQHAAGAKGGSNIKPWGAAAAASPPKSMCPVMRPEIRADYCLRAEIPRIIRKHSHW